MFITTFSEAVTLRCSVKKVFLKISKISQENACNFIKKETLAQVSFCEFCKVFKNIFFHKKKLSDGCFCYLELFMLTSVEIRR